MRSRFNSALVLVFATACSSEPRGPEEALDRLRVAVEAQDPKVLYGALDSDSRWAVQSIWEYQRKIAGMVTERYPPGLRDRELRRVEPAMRAASPADFFADFALARGDPFAPLGGSAEELGSFARRQGNDVVTSTGRIVPMAAGPNGAWGYAAYREELIRWRGDAANDLKRVESDVAK